MYEEALEVLNIIENNGFKAYIVGGYVRDLFINRKSRDIDISTNAKPIDLSKIFPNIIVLEDYGCVKLKYKNYNFDITTFRKEKYGLSRKDLSFEYTDNIEEDILRRDFTINTLYMDKNGNIIDLINAKKDIYNKTIRINGNILQKLNEDPLRILRAIRFSCILDFKLDYMLEKEIIKNRKLLLKLSYDRKKDELNHIFMSLKGANGIRIINKLQLGEYLEIKHLNKCIWCSDVCGIWAQLEYSDKYNFSTLEKNLINDIKCILNNKKIDSYIVYKYGKYSSLVASEILQIPRIDIIDLYNSLPIYDKKDISISYNDVKNNIKDDIKFSDIIIDLEEKIVYNKLTNDKKELINYVKNNYGKD